jgi:phosphoserine phosphatase RsbU/P
MRKALFLIAAFVSLSAYSHAQPVPNLPAQAVPLTQWRSGLIEINEDWQAHDGDDMAWAKPDFDSSNWQTVDLEDMGPAQLGWSWYRKHVVVGADYPSVRLLLEGGEGVYELYVNGERMSGASLQSELNVCRPVGRVFKLDNKNGDFTLAIRTHVPTSYLAYRLPLFLTATVGQPTAIGYENQALLRERVDDALPSIAINLLLLLAGIAILGLFAAQHERREYLYLGLYLAIAGVSNGVWVPQRAGLLPIVSNLLFADPLTYLLTIAQIEFTFAFADKKMGRAWRAYELVLLAGPLASYAVWVRPLLADNYSLFESALTVPVALLLPVMLFVWYRRGNHEAGWLILPSLLPALSASLFNLGAASILFGWRALYFLLNPIPLGTVSLQLSDLSSLLFLLAIGFVMFFRFTRVSRRQAHTEAELDAAREVQRRLVQPLINTPGFLVESAYLPAAQVGGDFYQVRVCQDESLLIAVGDVSGKGLPAALSVAAIVGALRALPELAPALLLQALNRGLSGNLQGGFVTCCAARVAPDGSVTFANAGHLSPYCNGREIELESGFPLGVVPGTEYPETHFRLNPGDRLTMLSDGVVEARSTSGELFGFERTAAISGETADQVAKTAGLFGQEDDITVLTLQFAPKEAVRA